MNKKLPIEFTRACARSEEGFVVIAVLDDSDPYEPDARIYRYQHDHGAGPPWYYDNFDFHVEDITLFTNPEVDANDDYLTYLSSEGDVYHAWYKGNFREKINGAGAWSDDAKGYGRLMSFAQIGNRLYACGAGGQIYVRNGRDNWSLLTTKKLLDPQARAAASANAPSTKDPAFLDWLKNSIATEEPNILFNCIRGLAEDQIYLCGEAGTQPVLCYWDGSDLHDLKTYLPEGALTGIYVENPDSVWICGREGVLLHGSYARGFTPINMREQRNLFHTMTPYRGKIVLASSVRPGGLYELDPATSALTRFSPPLPKLEGEYIFYAGCFGEVLWVAGQKDVLRFDGATWERIDHPDI